MKDSLPRWQQHGYQRMTSVQYQDGQLLVRFADGSSARVEAARVLPPDVTTPNWPGLTLNPYEIVVPTAGAPVEVPWSTIRRLTDAEYEHHLAAAAIEQAQRIGERLEILRVRQGLSREAVAERAGITVDLLRRVERGQAGTLLPTLQAVLTALGATWCDLAETAEVSSSHSVSSGAAREE